MEAEKLSGRLIKTIFELILSETLYYELYRIPLKTP
jgi:hypothetical protein